MTAAAETPDLPFRACAFGLGIASAFPLPELEPLPAGRPVDLAIRRGRVEREADERSGDGRFFTWDEVGAFRVSTDGTSVEVDPAAGAEPRLLAMPLLGPVMAGCLHARGRLVFHASAVSLDGEGVVLLGDKGAGKSTTASALVANGHPLLSDDLVPLRPGEPGGAPVIDPAFAQVKLSDVSAAAVSLDAAVEAAPHPDIQKRLHRLGARGFSASPRPAAAFYVLERGPEAAILPLGPHEALPALIRFSYAIRFGRPALDGEAGARHLREVAATVAATRVARLVVPDGLERLGEAVRLLERTHAGAGGSAGAGAGAADDAA